MSEQLDPEDPGEAVIFLTLIIIMYFMMIF